MVLVSGVIENSFPVPCEVFIGRMFERTVKDLGNIMEIKREEK